LPFLPTGIIFSLCELLNILNPDRTRALLPRFQSLLHVFNGELERTEGSQLQRNSLLAKGRVKLSARLAFKLLRPKKQSTKGIRSKVLLQSLDQHDQDDVRESSSEDDIDVPQEVEQYVGDLIDSLAHQDTSVRYSAAKGIARVCTRLPSAFVRQITEAIVSLFPLDVIQHPDGSLDLSTASEFTWQGACFALAELARRGLLAPSQGTAAQYELDEQLSWVQRALFFDPRRGAHSVGAGVRDAACYVIWALARANEEASISAHAASIATNLVRVACTDREVSIRRAASAAFQECAGRMVSIVEDRVSGFC